MECPRCRKSRINCIRIKHSKNYVDVQKCCVCGFLFLTDEEAVKFATTVSKNLFMKELIALGKNQTK